MKFAICLAAAALCAFSTAAIAADEIDQNNPVPGAYTPATTPPNQVFTNGVSGTLTSLILTIDFSVTATGTLSPTEGFPPAGSTDVTLTATLLDQGDDCSLCTFANYTISQTQHVDYVGPTPFTITALGVSAPITIDSSNPFFQNFADGTSFEQSFSASLSASSSGFSLEGDDLVGTATYTFHYTTADDTGAVPEPASWAMMIVGFGAAGGMMRRGRRQVATA